MSRTNYQPPDDRILKNNTAPSADRPPTLNFSRLNNIECAWWEWRPEKRDTTPTLLFVHATGFHGRVWDQLIGNFPDRHILSVEMRGHGRSTGRPIEHWGVLVDDLVQFCAELNLRRVTGVGHSMGAHALLHAAAINSDPFERLILFDPVIFSPEDYEKARLASERHESHPTSKRKRHFASAEMMIERFRNRDPYEVFHASVLRDYCRFGLIETHDAPGDAGPFELACSPEMEASVYVSSFSNHEILDAARMLKMPCLVVRAAKGPFFDFKSSPTWPGLASIIPKGTDCYRPDMTHFHPLQDPADAAELINFVEAQTELGQLADAEFGQQEERKP